MSSDPNIESSSPLSPGFMKNRGGRETADMSKERCGGLGRSWTYNYLESWLILIKEMWLSFPFKLRDSVHHR